jgi:hypothetical protein
MAKKISFTIDRPLSSAERTKYNTLKKEVLDNLDIANSALMRVARDLRTIRDERLYREEADSFEVWCPKVLGKQRAYIYKLISAGDTLQTLLALGVPGTELPSSERLCRELARYPAADMKKIWSRAKELALMKGTAQPDSITVREAAVQIEGTPKAKERAAIELCQKLEGIGRSLKISIGWVDMTDRENARIKKALALIVARGSALLEERTDRY